MDVRTEDFPITVQAYEMLDGKEIFAAEQVVNSQADVNAFTARYAGKLIKAKQFTTPETKTNSADYTKPKSSAGAVIFVIVLILLILVALGIYTGWFQQHFGS